MVRYARAGAKRFASKPYPDDATPWSELVPRVPSDDSDSSEEPLKTAKKDNLNFSETLNHTTTESSDNSDSDASTASRKALKASILDSSKRLKKICEAAVDNSKGFSRNMKITEDSGFLKSPEVCKETKKRKKKKGLVQEVGVETYEHFLKEPKSNGKEKEENVLIKEFELDGSQEKKRKKKKKKGSKKHYEREELPEMEENVDENESRMEEAVEAVIEMDAEEPKKKKKKKKTSNDTGIEEDLHVANQEVVVHAESKAKKKKRKKAKKELEIDDTLEEACENVGESKKKAKKKKKSCEGRMDSLEHGSELNHLSPPEGNGNLSEDESKEETSFYNDDDSSDDDSNAVPVKVSHGNSQGKSSESECFECHEVGHLSRFCPQKKESNASFNKGQQCYVCQEEGHISRDCPTKSKGMSCFCCHEEGHLSRDCPQKGKGMSCYSCNEKGHISRDCPQKNKGMSCFSCGEEGHRSRDCPQKSKGMSCYSCNEEGHISRDCPQKKKGLSCYSCNEEGHISRNCPKIQMECYSCHETGHMSRDCPQNSFSSKPSMMKMGKHVLTEEGVEKITALRKKLEEDGTAEEDIEDAVQLAARREEKIHKHRSEKETGLVCYGCQKPGHRFSDCPDKKDASSGLCYTCGSTEHVSRNCNKKGKNEKLQEYPGAVCFRCNQQGHIARQCPTSRITCMECGEEGHIQRHCPSRSGFDKTQGQKRTFDDDEDGEAAAAPIKKKKNKVVKF